MDRFGVLRYGPTSEWDFLCLTPGARLVVPDGPRWEKPSLSLPFLSDQPISWRCPHDMTQAAREFEVLNTTEVYSRMTARAAHACARTGARLVVTVWETLVDHFTRWTPPYPYWAKTAIREAAAFVACTQRAAHWLTRAHGVAADRIQVVYPGVDLSRFRPQREDPRRETVRVLFAGRLEPQKGVLDLLRCWKSSLAPHPEAELWFCGDGSLRGLLNHVASAEPRIKVLGQLGRAQLPAIYAQCDILCAPSRKKAVWGLPTWEEQFCYAAVEAMASGLPVVAYASGALPEVVGHGNATVPEGDGAGLAKALLRLASDQEARRRQGRWNRKRAEERFDAAGTARHYARVFHRAAAGPEVTS